MEPHEELLHDRDGNPHWILWSDAVGPGNVLIGTGQEITNRKLAEQALEERTARLDALVANIPTGIVAIDRQHCVTMCNPEFERLFQYRESEIVGQPLVPLIVPEALREESASAFRQILAGNSTYSECSKNSQRWLRIAGRVTRRATRGEWRCHRRLCNLS